MTSLHIATVDTRHFSFVALGESAEAATAALMRGWKAHCDEPGRICDPYLITAEDVRTTELAVGQCARDGAIITSPSTLVPVVVPFTEEELCELLSAASAALADADSFDRLADHLDLSDDYMVTLRDKLSVYLDGENKPTSIAPLPAGPQYPQMRKLADFLAAEGVEDALEIHFVEDGSADNRYALDVELWSRDTAMHPFLVRHLATFWGCPAKDLNLYIEGDGFEASDAWHSVGAGDLRELADEIGSIAGGCFDVIYTFAEIKDLAAL